jgi:hypothetical protein
MNRRFRSTFFIALLASVALLASCENDSSRPDPAGPWDEVALIDAPQGTAFLDIALSETRGLAAGATAAGVAPHQTFTPFIASRQTDGAWAPASGIPLPSDGILTVVGMTPAGEAIVAGVDATSGTGFILDERGGWSRHDGAFGALAFAASGNMLRLAGSAAANQHVRVSTSADVWTPESLPFPAGAGERGIQDIAARNGHWAACGFDDAGDGSAEFPNRVLFVDDGAGWERIDAGCGGCSNREFEAVAVSASGGILLGGSITDFAGGASVYTASLLLRSTGGDWVEIVLPAADELEAVNDILLAADGTTYLACGREDGHILRWPVGGAAAREATFYSARINRLAESPDGSIWAAGAWLTAEGDVERPAIWKRGD